MNDSSHMEMLYGVCSRRRGGGEKIHVNITVYANHGVFKTMHSIDREGERNLDATEQLIQKVRHSIVIQLDTNNSTQVGIHQLHDNISVKKREGVNTCL